MTEAELIVIRAQIAALNSVVSCLTSELSKRGLLDVFDLVANVQSTAAKHRELGNGILAELMHQTSEYLLKTVRDPESKPETSGHDGSG